jgi:hypothetical protein
MGPHRTPPMVPALPPNIPTPIIPSQTPTRTLAGACWRSVVIHSHLYLRGCPPPTAANASPATPVLPLYLLNLPIRLRTSLIPTPTFPTLSRPMAHVRNIKAWGGRIRYGDNTLGCARQPAHGDQPGTKQIRGCPARGPIETMQSQAMLEYIWKVK